MNPKELKRYVTNEDKIDLVREHNANVTRRILEDMRKVKEIS